MEVTSENGHQLLNAMKAVLHSRKSDLEKIWLLEFLGIRGTLGTLTATPEEIE